MLQRTSWVYSCSCYCSWHRRVGACGGCRRPATDGFSSCCCCCCSCFLARLAGGEMHCFRHDGCQLWRIQTPNSSISWLQNCKDFVSSHVVQRQFHIQILYSNNIVFRCCAATISSDAVQQQFLPMLCSDNNFLRCCAAQQFLQLCSNNNSFRCAKLNISEEIENWQRETNKQTNTQNKNKNNTSSKQKQLNFIQFPHKIEYLWYLLTTYNTKFLDDLFWWVVLKLGYTVEDDATTTAYQPSKWKKVGLPRNNNWWRTSSPTIQNPTTQEFVSNKKIVKGQRTLMGPSQGLLWIPL